MQSNINFLPDLSNSEIGSPLALAALEQEMRRSDGCIRDMPSHANKDQARAARRASFLVSLNRRMSSESILGMCSAL